MCLPLLFWCYFKEDNLSQVSLSLSLSLLSLITLCCSQWSRESVSTAASTSPRATQSGTPWLPCQRPCGWWTGRATTRGNPSEWQKRRSGGRSHWGARAGWTAGQRRTSRCPSPTSTSPCLRSSLSLWRRERVRNAVFVNVFMWISEDSDVFQGVLCIVRGRILISKVVKIKKTDVSVSRNK